MNSNSSIKCPQCGFIGWSNEQSCRRCGCDWTYVYPTSFADEETSSSSKKRLIWLSVLAVFLVVVAIAFKLQPKENILPNNTSRKEIKKPLNKPGERVDYKEYMVAGKKNVVYFYADW